MKIIYYCYGAAHSSITAANIHLGHLPLEGRPAPRELLHQPGFDRAEAHELGDLRLMGTDEWGNEVHVLGLAGARRVMARALLDFLAALGVDTASLLLVDALQHAGVLLRLGGYASRRLGLVWCGRPLCALGVWLKYRAYAAHVRRVRQEVARLQPPTRTAP